MFNDRLKVRLGFVSIAALLLAIPSATAIAQCGGHGGMGGGHGGHGRGATHDDVHEGHSEHQQHCYAQGSNPSSTSYTPHGGVFLETGLHSLEVVYLPREVRVYLYGESRQPLSTRPLRAQMSPRRSSGSEVHQFPLHYVAQPVGSNDQDYLVAAIDMTELPDKTPITFQFENLPDEKDPKAEFTPLFLESKIRPYVARVSRSPRDRDGIIAQQSCPVTGAPLGSMGSPIKVLIGDRPVYLCCTGCIDQLKGAQEASLAGRPVPGTAR